MFIDMVACKLHAVETDPAITSFEGALKMLRQLGIEDFGHVLMSMPNKAYPKLSRLLPRMASEEVQQSWTGCSGVTLLRQTCAFVRSVAYHYLKITGSDLEGAAILDFGCGYGRIARLMYYFSDPFRVMGVDPWDRSIELCHKAGLGSQFVQSAYLPADLPVGSARFDLIFAFSVFTHLSERAARIALQTMTKYLNPGGLLAITVRPVEYWNHDSAARSRGLVEQQITLHRQKGFSFLPHARPPVDGDVTYGDTTLTPKWLADNFPQLPIVGQDRSLNDELQIYLFLQPLDPRSKEASPKAGI
jgi:SAM-dependent methyltransferase